ncbi:hypothetical protein E4U43_001798 [Claviceps pusilla]|uniref:Secreted protein n=1 Tax=Claviceps pusilla TaxID=123648 RepID=A0A9P7N9R5_9HYPO|nr:hypothetical protein E4U43_001798 [Claviceps pusilla]
MAHGPAASQGRRHWRWFFRQVLVALAGSVTGHWTAPGDSGAGVSDLGHACAAPLLLSASSSRLDKDQTWVR